MARLHPDPAGPRRRSGPASGRTPSLIGGIALAVASVLVCLLAGEAISRLSDPAASLWRWPDRLADASQTAPGTTQFAYDATLGWAPIAGSAGTMLGKPLSFTAQGMREHNREGPPAAGPLIRRRRRDLARRAGAPHRPPGPERRRARLRPRTDGPAGRATGSGTEALDRHPGLHRRRHFAHRSRGPRFPRQALLPARGRRTDVAQRAGSGQTLPVLDRGCTARAGLATLDTSPALAKENVASNIDAYYTMMHFTGRGADLAAREIAAALRTSSE